MLHSELVQPVFKRLQVHRRLWRRLRMRSKEVGDRRVYTSVQKRQYALHKRQGHALQNSHCPIHGGRLLGGSAHRRGGQRASQLRRLPETLRISFIGSPATSSHRQRRPNYAWTGLVRVLSPVARVVKAKILWIVHELSSPLIYGKSPLLDS